MKYRNLNDLCRHSKSSRAYFLSLPVDMQMQICRGADAIHTAAELHDAVGRCDAYNRAVALSESIRWRKGLGKFFD